MNNCFRLFLFFSVVLMIPILCQAFDNWPDTGQTTSYTVTFVEDLGYTINPHSYTELGHSGVVLSDAATSTDVWMIVRDNVSEFIREIKKNVDSIHDKGFLICKESHKNLCDREEQNT